MSNVNGRTKLETWKEVAAYLGKDERTVRRWEAERGLPVRRLPGESRSRVYADTADLDRWLTGAVSPNDRAPQAVEPDDLDAAPDARTDPLAAGAALRPADRVLRITVALVLVPLTLAGVLVFGTRVWRPPADQPPLDAQQLYRAGMDDFRRRTPESLPRAVDEFSAAIRRDPSYAQAYVGLAESYNVLREFTLLAPDQAYALADAATRRALQLNDSLPEAHACLAFIDAYWRWDRSAARREYKRAIALDPNSAQAHHWFATFLMAQGDYSASRVEFDRARALDPTSKVIQADAALVEAPLGRPDLGRGRLEDLEKADPSFLPPHKYLSGIYLALGRDADFLREAGLAAQLTGDRQRQVVVAAGREGLAAGGRRSMLERMAQEQERQYRNGVGSAYALAESFAMIGDAAKTEAYLLQALERREERLADIQGSRDLFARVMGRDRLEAITARVTPR